MRFGRLSNLENLLNCGVSTREALAKVRLKAFRCGVWFKSLSKNERNLLDLVIRVTEKVRSFLLARVLSPILKKLLEAIGGIKNVIGEVAYRIRTDGFRLAQKLSQIAMGWGNKSASKWPEDIGLKQYLTIMDLNKT